MNYYKELNINEDASLEEIRSAYKILALKWHPDRNKNNQEEAEHKFKIISEAYQILTDKQKNTNDISKEYTFKSPNDIFQTFFQNIPLEYIEIANTFIYQFVNSPECDLTFKILINMPNKDSIIKVLEILKNDLQNETRQIIEKYIDKMKRQQKENTHNTNNSINKIKVSNKSMNDEYLKNKKNDIEFNVNCSLEDIYNKVEKEITISRININNKNQQNINNLFDNCDYYNENKTIKFPANYRPILTLKNEGNLLPGSTTAGDVIININNKKHPLFEIINDYDLFFKRYISIYELYNGSIFTIDYFNNRKLSIRTNQQIFKNTLQKINNFGLPIPQTDTFGHLYIEFIVQYPNVNSIHNKLLFEIFPPLNTGVPDNIDIQNHEDCLLDDTHNFED